AESMVHRGRPRKGSIAAGHPAPGCPTRAALLRLGVLPGVADRVLELVPGAGVVLLPAAAGVRLDVLPPVGALLAGVEVVAELVGREVRVEGALALLSLEEGPVLGGLEGAELPELDLGRADLVRDGGGAVRHVAPHDDLLDDARPLRDHRLV